MRTQDKRRRDAKRSRFYVVGEAARKLVHAGYAAGAITAKHGDILALYAAAFEFVAAVDGEAVPAKIMAALKSVKP